MELYPVLLNFLIFQTKPNSDYTFWMRHDKFDLNALLASLSLDVSQIVLGVQTLNQVWQRLSLTFAKPLRQHLPRLREKLIKTQGSRFVTNYLQDIEFAYDELALLNHPIDVDDLVLYIVNWLSPSLKDILATIRKRLNQFRLKI